MTSPLGLRVRKYPYKNGGIAGMRVIKAVPITESIGIKRSGKVGTVPARPNLWECTMQDAENIKVTTVCVLTYPEDFNVLRLKAKG